MGFAADDHRGVGLGGVFRRRYLADGSEFRAAMFGELVACELTAIDQVLGENALRYWGNAFRYCGFLMS